MSRPAHRPPGSGATTVRVARRTDGNAGYNVFISRTLWQQLGCPARVTIAAAPPSWRIAIGAAWRHGK